jgi:antitoxin ParD1/3/4
MTDLSFSLPPDLARRIESRIAQGEYVDAGDYLRDLIRRDLDEAADVAWVREQVAEGLASGFIERDAREVLKEIVADRRARRG